jgi:N-dimethylarginine dimethylaminohydrolase
MITIAQSKIQETRILMSNIKNSTEHYPRLLMCAPDHFEVTYEINQWMQPQTWSHNSSELLKVAQQEWRFLNQTFKTLGFDVELVKPQPGLPDMVFTANAAVILNERVLLARFRFQERQPEEKPFAQYFELAKRKGLVKEVNSFPVGIFQEGAGDCIWDNQRQIFWAGYGPRSSKEATDYIGDYFGKEVVALELSPRFYHLDLSLSPLSNGQVLYYPGAFTGSAQKIIKDRIPANELIAIDKEDAENFVCNLVNVGKQIILSNCSSQLESKLNNLGYSVISTPVRKFGLAGGSVCCLTLKLDLTSKH